ncbi:hypothetical protein NHX12_021028 [Muraenolepis orangiensis]|uniref:Uncharacterized protein n=1 Tax=Muraenolepis orangiensis TaxID=630683 RepID=A0A9Q0EUN9_9TELE|nr:hypothetical protein NHX12_021028 [Muraenolepis orangiensis]
MLLAPGFLTDLMAKLNALNNQLQGKDRHLPHVISAVNVFKAKLGVWTTHLKNGRLTQFSKLEEMSQTIEDKNVSHPEQNWAHLEKGKEQSSTCVLTYPFKGFGPIMQEHVEAIGSGSGRSLPVNGTTERGLPLCAADLRRPRK